MHVMVSMAKAMLMLRAKKSLFFALLGAASLSAALAAARCAKQMAFHRYGDRQRRACFGQSGSPK
jgi:hypothetical protein